MHTELAALAEYFGEEHAPADPTRVLRTVRDFVVLFDRALADIEVGGRRVGGCARGWAA